LPKELADAEWSPKRCARPTLPNFPAAAGDLFSVVVNNMDLSGIAWRYKLTVNNPD
jgi:hypothetical protein